MTTLSSANHASSRSRIALSGRVETALENVYRKHNSIPLNDETRQRLSSIAEDLAFDLVRKVYRHAGVIPNLDGFIISKFNQAVTLSGSPRLSFSESPAQSRNPSGRHVRRILQEEMSVDYDAPSPKSLQREDSGGSLHTPQLLALSELEFRKAFLLLSYIPGKFLDQVISADEIRQWKDLPMVAYETEVWNCRGRLKCPQTDRIVLQWDSKKTHYYQCHVASDGSYTFKGPLLEHTATHLHKVLGDENVLTVKFADVQQKSSTYSSDCYSTYKRIAKNGIMIGLRRYQFFVFKDGGKEKKKKDFSTNGVKCYFIRTDSTASNDMENPYIFSGKSIYEARMHFMHVHTLPSLANYMARFSLILSKTKTLEVDMSGIIFEQISDINCHDRNDEDVFDKNGKPCIHSDGTGNISEDLARMCPLNISEGKCPGSQKTQDASRQDPPLLIQFRMFYNGNAVKGIFLLNKKIPRQTVQVRPSMIKVYKDPDLSNCSTFNALEVVSTRTKLSRNLVALLSYGGVPDKFFLDILHNTLEESKTMFYDEHDAYKAAMNHGEMDDYTASEMILARIPLDEPYLKYRLSIILKTVRNDLKVGKLPITESYYLMGTVDPTGELKEDEVCVILESGQISGNVIVYRNPGLHFGDIHILKATYVKSLEEYVGNSKYAVFFPQKGPRSLGDEIAGGDFDGDLYFVSRNPEVLEHFKPSDPWVSLSCPSKSNTAKKPSQLSPEELEEELFEMFLKTRFHPCNVVGIAADSWLTIMDRFITLGDERVEEKAEMKKKMLELIDIYYDALDAPKKGATVYLPNELRPDLLPHYMERGKSFKSTSILGRIFDIVKSQTTEKPSPSSEIWKLPCFKDEAVSKFHMKKSKLMYEKYKAEMCQAMNIEGSDKNEVIERYKQEFYGFARFEDCKKSLEELYPEALALYNIVYDYAKQEGVSKCAFVWRVAGPVLCRFYLMKMHEKSMVCSVSMVKKIWG